MGCFLGGRNVLSKLSQGDLWGKGDGDTPNGMNGSSFEFTKITARAPACEAKEPGRLGCHTAEQEFVYSGVNFKTRLHCTPGFCGE